MSGTQNSSLRTSVRLLILAAIVILSVSAAGLATAADEEIPPEKHLYTEPTAVTESAPPLPLAPPIVDSAGLAAVFANGGAMAVPGASTSGPASPYPSTINVAGMLGTITKVTATLYGISHTWPADIDILLVSPGGQKVILMSDIGGSIDLNSVTFTFDDAGGPLGAGANGSGTYRPTNLNDNIGTDAFSGAPAGPYSGFMSTFNGVSPNGAWHLYVVDDTSGDAWRINQGWSLNIITLAPSACSMLQASNRTPAVGQVVQFTGHATNGTGTGAIAAYRFDFGDGTTTGWVNVVTWSGSIVVNKTYTATAIRNVHFSVRQVDGTVRGGAGTQCALTVNVGSVSPLPGDFVQFLPTIISAYQ